MALYLYLVSTGSHVADYLDFAWYTILLLEAHQFRLMLAIGLLADDGDSADNFGQVLFLVTSGLSEDMAAVDSNRRHNLHAIATRLAALLWAYMLADGMETIAWLEALG